MIGSKSSQVYVAEAENGMLKIGVSNNAVQRVIALHLQSPIRVRLIALFPGSYRDELKMHDRFKDQRAWGEWFYPCGSILQFVSENRWHGCKPVEWHELNGAGLGWQSATAREKRSVSMKAAWAKPGARENWFRRFASPSDREATHS